MKVIFVFFFLLNALWAQPIGEMLKGVKLDKSQVMMMIDQMESSGQISKKDAAAAKKELGGMSQSQLDSMGAKAIKILENSSKPGAAKDPRVEKALELVDEAQKKLEAN